MPRRWHKPPRDLVLDRIEFYQDVGATASEISDETLLPLTQIMTIIERLAAEGLIARNGRVRRIGKKTTEHAAVWIAVRQAEAS
jgi:hypothetical protein